MECDFDVRNLETRVVNWTPMARRHACNLGILHPALACRGRSAIRHGTRRAVTHNLCTIDVFAAALWST
eukprot:11220744-Lingulodinium_polyedra.AAC.1